MPGPTSPLAIPSMNLGTHQDEGTTPSVKEHGHRRFFIGPMPEKVVSRSEAQNPRNSRSGLLHASSSVDSTDVDGESTNLVDEYAFNFFIHQGGDIEDWGEGTEESVRREMLRRWRETEWGRIWRRRNAQRDRKDIRPPRWVGASFEIGNFLGVNMLTEERPESLWDRMSVMSGGASVRTRLDSEVRSQRPGMMARSSSGAAGIQRLSPPSPPDSGAQLTSDDDLPETSSSTGLLRPSPGVHARTDTVRRPILRPSLSNLAKSDGHIGFAHPPNRSQVSLKPKRRQTQESIQEVEELAPANEVLERTGSAVDETSAGVSDYASPSLSKVKWGDVVLRDRMLVRVSYIKSESLGSSFDEVQNRTTNHLQYEDWAEFMVVWRKDRLELYEDYSIPGKEWLTKHKHLAFLVPLDSQSTKLSLYSFVDLTFCLTCPPTPVHSESKARFIFHRSKEGTNIFVFKIKARSRALDWMWHLWRQLGGEIPPFIEVRSPNLDARVKIDMPSLELGARGYATFSCENIIALCKKSMANVRDWKDVVDRQLAAGQSLALAWRLETRLDWVWLETDVEGRRREWAVLCGLALRQSEKSAHLEIHVKDHFPTSVHLPDDRKIQEPPGIEGYLDRIKPNSHVKQAVYLATHDGNLFLLNPAQGHPPPPPGLLAMAESSTEGEMKRGSAQILVAHGVCDLRSVLAIRRAFQLVPAAMHRGEADAADDRFEAWSEEPGSHSDDEDEGGDDGMAKSADKPMLRQQRAFELLLVTGHVVRFEAYSRRTALEWISRLRALVFYWKERHRIDAREEMNLAQVGSRRPWLTPPMHAHCGGHDLPPQPPPDPEASLPALSTLYNWCVMNGCKPILKGGKLFTRRGLHGQYKLVQLFLVSGHLVEYRIHPASSLHHRQSKVIYLLDAYICSGYFAALSLPRGQWSPSAPNVPRRYPDGLEADDPEEDMLFMIWYRPRAPTDPDGKPTENIPVPTLSAKRKVAVFKTRSKLERDAWCWALNCEIEKLVREQKEREAKLRETGGLSKT